MILNFNLKFLYMSWNQRKIVLLPSMTALTPSEAGNTWEFLKQLPLLNGSRYVVRGLRGEEAVKKSINRSGGRARRCWNMKWKTWVKCKKGGPKKGQSRMRQSGYERIMVIEKARRVFLIILHFFDPRHDEPLGCGMHQVVKNTPPWHVYVWPWPLIS